MKRKSIKGVFLFFIIYLPLQYGLVGIVGFYQSEPWPAFVFPGFKNVYVFDSGYEIQQTHFELKDIENDNVLELSTIQFFPEIPRSMISGFIRSRFSSQSMIQSYDNSTGEWMLEKASMEAGFNVDRITVHHFVKYFSSQTGQILLEPDSVVTTNRIMIAEKGDNE